MRAVVAGVGMLRMGATTRDAVPPLEPEPRRADTVPHAWTVDAYTVERWRLLYHLAL